MAGCCKGCGVCVGQSILIFSGLLEILAGALLIVLGTSVMPDWATESTDFYHFHSKMGFLIAGIVILVVGCFGLLGNYTKNCCLLGIYVIVSIIIALIVMATGATLMVFGYAGPSQMQAALCDDDNDFGKWWSAAEKTVLDECAPKGHYNAFACGDAFIDQFESEQGSLDEGHQLPRDQLREFLLVGQKIEMGLQCGGFCESGAPIFSANSEEELSETRPGCVREIGEWLRTNDVGHWGTGLLVVGVIILLSTCVACVRCRRQTTNAAVSNGNPDAPYVVNVYGQAADPKQAGYVNGGSNATTARTDQQGFAYA
uniref:Tetraspanin n=1 Tax=Vitrella brassicaformis TaxID=1169539 RepID=A0A7S1KFT8_9ALVE|mmetsp:Transcript_52683/g.132419  ORF Transcript_52683/g.132419 Transcript_52683/m.132419 type:complete len:314 (+) Transcript_52683:313-1254(+)